ncbi:MAG: SPASM domain-containing protein [Armatimonadota bacterium]
MESSEVRLSELDVDVLAARIARRFEMTCGAPAFGLVDMMLTRDCNHRCDYCFVRSKRPERMTWETAKATVDFFLKQPGPPRDNGYQILFFGGEPLLEFDLIRQIVDYTEWLQERTGVPFRYSMTTNGTLLTEGMCSFFRSHRIAYLLSIDGDKETHDAHRKLRGGGSSYDLMLPDRFRMAKQHQPWQGTRMTVRPDTVRRLVDNVKHLHALGMNQFLIGIATGLQWSRDDFVEYEAQLLALMDLHQEMRERKRPFRMTLYEKDLRSPPGTSTNTWGCGAGRGRMAADPGGNIYGCAKIAGLDRPELLRDQCLGNVFEGITHPDRRAMVADNTTTHRPKCVRCKYRHDCGGGCPATNLEASGSIFDPAPEECMIIPGIINIRKRLFADGPERDRG